MIVTTCLVNVHRPKTWDYVSTNQMIVVMQMCRCVVQDGITYMNHKNVTNRVIASSKRRIHTSTAIAVRDIPVYTVRDKKSTRAAFHVSAEARAGGGIKIGTGVIQIIWRWILFVVIVIEHMEGIRGGSAPRRSGWRARS